MLPDLLKISESNNINFLDVGCNIIQLFFMKKIYKKVMNTTFYNSTIN